MKKYLLILLLIPAAFISQLNAQLLSPISEGINPNGSQPDDFTKLRDHVYLFSAKSVEHGNEPYVTDGTQAGTFLLKDINTGTESSDGYNNARFYRLNDTICLFAANDGDSIHGIELWRTNGDSTGTYMVADLTPGAASSLMSFSNIQLNNKMFFTACSLNSNQWITDGTSQGTTQLTSGVDAGNVVAVTNGIAYFNVIDGVNQRIFLWRTDGTVDGTFQLLLSTDQSLGSFSHGTAFNDKYIFMSRDSIHGMELWQSDGTIGGTTLLKDLDSSAEDSYPKNFFCLGDKLLFHSSSSQTIWVTDGTDTGTYQLGDTSVFPIGSGSWIEDVSNGNAYFRVSGLTESIWKTDGTIQGTVLLHTFSCDCTFGGDYDSIVQGYGFTFFIIYEDFYVYDFGSIWATDGTESGTYQIYADSVFDFYPIEQLIGVCDEVFCSVNGDFWLVNPNTAYNLNLFANPCGPEIYLVDDSLIFFTAYGNNNQHELYKLQVCGVFTEAQNISVINSLTIFPNPNDGLFTLELPDNSSNAEVRVIDMMGKCRYANKISPSPDRKLNLQVESIPAGIYSLQIISNEQRWRQIFIKQ